jgi:hypothetical protein
MWIFGLFVLIVLASLWASFLPAPLPEEKNEDAGEIPDKSIDPGEFPRIVLDGEEPEESDGPIEEESPDAPEPVEPDPCKEAA